MPAKALAALRAAAEAEIERLLVLLDTLDGDPDLEPTMGYQPYPNEHEPDADDEPSLGSLSCLPTIFGGYQQPRGADWTQEHWSAGSLDDAEEQVEDEGADDVDLEDNGDAEPSLGSVNGQFPNIIQDSWSQDNDRGRDDERDDADMEPSLGALTCIGNFSPGDDRQIRSIRGGTAVHIFDPWDQSRWCSGGMQDLEKQCEDEGAQCEDEGATEHQNEWRAGTAATPNYAGPCSPVVGGRVS